MDAKTLALVEIAQKNEITEHYVYKSIARRMKVQKNKEIIARLAKDELRHYNYWKSISKKDIKPKFFKRYIYIMFSYIFGFTFALRLMEKGEEMAQKAYDELSKKFEPSKKIMMEENQHEKELIGILEEEKLEYASSIVLGLNDALVELTGALAGLTLALQNTRLIGIIGLITGIAASMSMAASNYLSSKEDGDSKRSPLKSAVYTGIAYILTVVLLVIPYFVLSSVFVALTVTLSLALLIILTYTFYITTAKDLKFWKRFLEMAILSLTVAAISFGIGFLVKNIFGIDV